MGNTLGNMPDAGQRARVPYESDHDANISLHTAKVTNGVQGQQDALSVDESINEARGLTTKAALQRLMAEGPNEVGAATIRTGPAIALDVVQEPMFLLLIAGGVTYLVLGDLAEAIILSLFACVSVVITIVQEIRSEHALEALRALAAPRARVVRDGGAAEIAAREVVRGDLLVLDAGDRIPADAVLLGDAALEVDESLLTGESAPVPKTAGVDGAVKAGTLVTQGAGTACVVATGSASAIGRIAGALSALDVGAPRLRQETQAIVRISALCGGAVALAVFLIHGLMRHDWSAGLLSGIAVGMSLLPEEFAVVLAVYLAMGARRLSTVGVLTRRAAAIETLGAATVLCTDKTGTLTENQMRVVDWWAPGAESSDRLRSIAAAACLPASADPMDVAIRIGCEEPTRSPAKSFSLRRDLLAVGAAYANADGTAEVAVKGAPEAVLALCEADASLRTLVQARVASMAAAGQRVLAVASASIPVNTIPERLDALLYRLDGLVGLIDPVRADVPPAVARLRAAGIRVVMITGDHPATARAIASQAGIAEGNLLVGSELETLSDEALALALPDVTIIARVSPDQKLRILRALHNAGEVAAMIGDGVNDAPALRAADIGVAMGRRGTDVAREAGDLVLLDDRFASIPDAVGLGRRIYNNIRQAAGFIVSVHVPIAGLAILPLVTGSPLLLGPLHIALLEIVIDPVCALVFEAEPEGEGSMTRPPRAANAHLFDRSMLIWSVCLGATAFAIASVVAGLAGPLGTPDQVRAVTFVTLCTLLLCMIHLHRGRLRVGGIDGKATNRMSAAVAVIVAVMLAAILNVPVLRTALALAPPSGNMWALAVAGCITFALAGGLTVRVWHPYNHVQR